MSDLELDRDLDLDGGTEFLHEEYSPSPQYEAEDGWVSCANDESCADIVFVQGLASRYQTTWSVEDSTEPDGRYYWLRHKLPQDVRNGRILAFEYDSSWYDNPAYVDLEDCAIWLLNSLIRDRQHPEGSRLCPLNKRKPLVLIGHSFGGLVIKQALVMAGLSRPSKDPASHARYLNYQDLLSAVTGVIFLGTPHRGTTFSKWATLKVRVGSFLGQQVHDELVNLLTLNNPVLKSLHRQFSRLLERELSGLRICCFYEIRSVSIPPQVVVPEGSASLDRAENIPLDANHIELNKFRKHKDKSYDLFVKALQSLLSGCKELAESRFAAQRYNDSQASFELQNLKRWLNPSNEVQALTHSTRLKEQRSAPFTCSWVTDVGQFGSWLTSPEPQPLWIHGQAGSGKSVLCSYLIEMLSAASQSDRTACISSVQSHDASHCQPHSHSVVLYFLNGVDKEHETPWAFTGTLIHQLLLTNACNDQVFQTALNAYILHQSNPRASSADTKIIVDLLKTLTSLLNTVYILIDGLEENSDLSGCLQCLSALRDVPNVRFILFGQDVTEVKSLLSECFPLLMPLSVKQYTIADVENFATFKAEQLVQQKTELAPKISQIKEKLLSGADGIFQWVNESVGYLRSVAVNSYNVEDCLKEMPVGLHSSYDKIFARMVRADVSIRRKVQVALRWLTVAARPLSIRELWTAICIESRRTGDLLSALDKCTADPLSDSKIIDELDQLLSPLVRISPSTTSGYYVSLIHPSLRVAITGCFIHEDVSPQAESFHFAESSAHLHCARVCMELCAETTLQLASCRGTSLSPLVDYAWTFFAYHKNLCGGSIEHGYDQMDLMILGVVRDCVVMLNALLDFASTHLAETHLVCNNLQSTLAVKMAQDSLSPAIEALVLVSQSDSFAAALVEARKRTQADIALRPRQGQSTDIQPQLSGGWVARMRKKISPAPSATLRLKIDSVFAQRPQLGKSQAKATEILTRAAQCLRLVALRFSIEPIAETMKARHKSESLSAISCLTRVANLLEECGNYPYWDLESVSSHQAYSAPFVVADDDQFFGPAMYVLQALDDSNINNNQATWSDDDRMNLLERTPSGPLEITQAHEQHVDKVHQIPGSSYIVAQYTHAMLSNGTFLELNWWAESMKQAHVEASLMLRNVSGQFMTADQVLASYAPESYFRNEHQEFIRAIPQLLKVTYMSYISMLLEFFAGLTKAALAVHISSLRVCFGDLEVISSIFSACLVDNGLLTKLDLFFGFVVFILRCFCFRWYSLFYSIPTWRDLYLGLRHPAPFLNMEASIGFWEGTAIWVICFGMEMLLLMPIQLLPLYSTRNTWSNRLLRYIVSFHTYLILERIAFRLCHILVTAVAAGKVIFSSPESVGGAVDFSVYYWLLQAWNIALNLGRTTLTQGYNIQGLGHFALTLLQIALIFGFARYFGSVFDLIKKLFYPLMLPYWIAVRILLLPWAKVLRVLGATMFVLMVGFAIFIARQYWKDPYGLRYSLSGLERARNIIRDSRIAQGGMMSLEAIGVGNHSNPSRKQPVKRVHGIQNTLSTPPASLRIRSAMTTDDTMGEAITGGVPSSHRVDSAHIKTE